MRIGLLALMVSGRLEVDEDTLRRERSALAAQVVIFDGGPMTGELEEDFHPLVLDFACALHGVHYSLLPGSRFGKSRFVSWVEDDPDEVLNALEIIEAAALRSDRLALQWALQGLWEPFCGDDEPRTYDELDTIIARGLNRFDRSTRRDRSAPWIPGVGEADLRLAIDSIESLATDRSVRPGWFDDEMALFRSLEAARLSGWSWADFLGLPAGPLRHEYARSGAKDGEESTWLDLDDLVWGTGPKPEDPLEVRIATAPGAGQYMAPRLLAEAAEEVASVDVDRAAVLLRQAVVTGDSINALAGSPTLRSAVSNHVDEFWWTVAPEDRDARFW